MSAKEYPFSWRLAINTPRSGWRGRLGFSLRRLARRIDGEVSLQLRFETEPTLSNRDVFEIVQCGFKRMEQATHDATEIACEEMAMRAEHPRLYEGA